MGVATFTVDEGRGGGLRFQGTTLRGYPWSHVRGLPAYRYQVLLGSDDLLHPSMVEASLRAMEGHRRALASHLPIMVDVGRKPWRCYRMKAMPRPSPILVLKQDPLDARYTWVWSRDHRHLGRVVDRVAYIEEGYAAMGIHDHNDGTRISPRQPEIEVPPWLR